MKFKKEEMKEMAFKESGRLIQVENKITDGGRWTNGHEVIFKDKETGKYYESFYEMGATECQESEPYEYEDDEIECQEMHKVEKLVKVWEPVEWRIVMRKYKKKPVTIEACQLTKRTAHAILKWVGTANIQAYNLGELSEDPCFMTIKTLEGLMLADENDFIIKGIEGEFYPCKPSIFYKTYEIEVVE